MAGVAEKRATLAAKDATRMLGYTVNFVSVRIFRVAAFRVPYFRRGPRTAAWTRVSLVSWQLMKRRLVLVIFSPSVLVSRVRPSLW